MTAIDQAVAAAKKPVPGTCGTAAVHTWAMMVSGELYREPEPKAA